jgi:hypothetical protein
MSLLLQIFIGFELLSHIRSWLPLHKKSNGSNLSWDLNKKQLFGIAGKSKMFATQKLMCSVN